MLTLGFFSLEGNPLLYMRESYYDYVLFWERILREIEEEVTVDVLQVVSLQFVGWNKGKDRKFLHGCSPNWVNHVYLCLYFITLSILFLHLFYCSGILFLTRLRKRSTSRNQKHLSYMERNPMCVSSKKAIRA